MFSSSNHFCAPKEPYGQNPPEQISYAIFYPCSPPRRFADPVSLLPIATYTAHSIAKISPRAYNPRQPHNSGTLTTNLPPSPKKESPPCQLYGTAAPAPSASSL